MVRRESATLADLRTRGNPVADDRVSGPTWEMVANISNFCAFIVVTLVYNLLAGEGETANRQSSYWRRRGNGPA